MIVEEKDALDIRDQFEYVAEEVIIEETVDDVEYTEIECLSPNSFNQSANTKTNENSENNEIHENYENNGANALSKPNDNNDGVQAPINPTNADCGTIYLSDSMSCFDSDSDTQDSEMPASSSNVDGETANSPFAQQTNDDSVNEETEAMNESADDVIIVTECTELIEIDRSDSEDERIASKFSFEPYIESDSQQPTDSAKDDDTENSSKRRYNSAELDETDADDDSSEVDKRTTRARRDNVTRKNYSIRRTYARRKLKNDAESPLPNEISQTKNEEYFSYELDQQQNVPGEERLSNETVENKVNVKLIQDCNTTDGTDEDSQLNATRTKARTYVRKKAPVPNLAFTENVNVAGSKVIVKLESDSQGEHPINVPRKRGRPRKKNIANILKSKSSETDDKEFSLSSEDQSRFGVLENVETNIPIDTLKTCKTEEISQTKTESEKPIPTVFLDSVENEVILTEIAKCESKNVYMVQSSKDEENIVETTPSASISNTNFESVIQWQNIDDDNDKMETETTDKTDENHSCQKEGDESIKVGDVSNVSTVTMEIDCSIDCHESEPAAGEFRTHHKFSHFSHYLFFSHYFF